MSIDCMLAAGAQGMLRGEDLSAAYASADIFMMPSETETLGFEALEAMASGLAVVAVAAGGLVDIITKPGTIGGPCPHATCSMQHATCMASQCMQGCGTGVHECSPWHAVSDMPGESSYPEANTCH